MNFFTSEAWLQLTHKKSRLFVSLLSVMLSVTLMFTTTALRDGIFEDAVTIHKSLRADLFIQPGQLEYFWALSARGFPRRVMDRVAAIGGVTETSPFYMNWTNFKNPETLAQKQITIFAFDPERPVFNLPEINQQLDVITRSNTWLYDQLAKPGYGPIIQEVQEKGSFTTEIADKKITIAGLFTLGGGILSANGILITSDFNYSNLLGFSLAKVSLGLVNLEEGVDPQAIKQEIVSILPKGIEVLTKEELIANEKKYWTTGSPIGFIFNTLAVIGSIFGGVIVYQILFTQISDYLSVYATFKAIGYTNQYLINTVLQESMLMAVLGYIPGYIFCLYLFNLVQSATRLPMDMSFSRAALVLVLTFITCALASIVAIVKLKDADPADLFR
ncbi:ABC transporter permease DevC [Leptothoe sp. EHU-05/26/07-4]